MAKKEDTSNQNTIDLPEVKDIPGQEHVRPLRMGELSDVTVSSADEEGDDVLEPGNEDEIGIVMGNDGDVSAEERSTLANIDKRRADSEDEVLSEVALDDRDDDGTPLNEKSSRRDRAGDDLDVPGSEDDDADEALGEEDEENNDYSVSDNNDD